MANRQHLVDAVHRRLDGVTRRQAAAIVDAIFTVLTDLLADGERVMLAGFGSFELRRRPARRGRHPATGEPLELPAVNVVRFRAAKQLLDRPREAVVAKAEHGGGDARLDDEDMEMLPPPEVVHRGLGAAREEEGYTVVEVAYATDRAATGAAAPAERYGGERGDGSLAYGVCEVSIPEDHKIGRLEGPSWRRFEFRPDPEKHVVLLRVDEYPEDAFFAGLAARVGASSGREMLVFLHGFNVSFEDAARRTAQIAYDLKFEGVPAFYSWPSQNSLSPAGYLRDAANVEWTVPHLRRFLDQLAARSGAEAIHLIAHSMGNRALTHALEGIAAAMGERDAPRFREVILTAPDVDAGVFRQLAAAMRPAAGRLTLYASGKDRALQASQKFNGFPRAGDTADVVVLPEVDTIDATDVDTDLVGHFYYGDNRSVLSDVFNLLHGGDPPGRRFGLKERKTATGRYWVFVGS